MEIYADRIAAAQDFEALCNIVEDAADDERITNEEYRAVYDLALTKAQTLF